MGAGLGSRLKPFVNLRPKPLIPVLGVPCIDFSLALLKDAGVPASVVNIHSKPDQMKAYLQGKQGIEISDESALLLGSAGGFRKALSRFDRKPFFSMNADVICDVDLKKLQARHEELQKKQDVWMTLALVRGKTLQAQTGTYSEIFVDEASGLISGFGAKKNHTPYYSGVAVFDPRCFEHLKEGAPAEFVPEVLEPMIKAKKVGFSWFEGIWIDIGSPELWWKAHFDLKRAYEQKLLPECWNKLISKKIESVFVSEADGIVDYDQTEKDADDASRLGKNTIRMETVEYAISNLGHLA